MAHPHLVVAALTVAALSSLACREAPEDPLDPELLAELALERGEASGHERAGLWSLKLDVDECDCPLIEEFSADICALSRSTQLPAKIQEGGGALVILFDTNGELGLVSGAIESDDSFDLAGRHHATTIIGSLTIHRRVIGSFDPDDDRAEGWIGHRFIAEIATESIDCRSSGDFTATRL